MRVSQEEARDNGPGSVLNEYSFRVIISGKTSRVAGCGWLASSLQNLNLKDRYYLRVKSSEKIFQLNGPKKQADIAILISNKIHFKLKSIKRDRKFRLIPGKIYEKTR